MNSQTAGISTPKGSQQFALNDMACSLELCAAGAGCICVRSAAQVNTPTQPSSVPDAAPAEPESCSLLPHTVGLSLPGSDIRSAIFYPGFLNALSRRRMLGKFDLLSTVSGGGYIGGFPGALFPGGFDARRK